MVHCWVDGLPGQVGTSIVSLLGRKPARRGIQLRSSARRRERGARLATDGRSEFAFYSFRGGFDSPDHRPGCPTFQEWLDQWHGDRGLHVFEYATTDVEPLLPEVLAAVSTKIRDLLSEARTVVLVDSGGIGRTGRVCKHLGFST